MKKSFVFVLSIVFIGAFLCSCSDSENYSGEHLWSKRFGGTSIDTALSIAVDSGGNVLVTGWFDGTANFGGGDLTSAGFYDIFVAKFMK